MLQELDCKSPDRSLFVRGDVKIEGDKRTKSALLVQGDVKKAASIAIIDTSINTIFYYFHEATYENMKNNNTCIYSSETASLKRRSPAPNRTLDDVGPPLSLTLAVQQPICLERLHMHALPSSASTSAQMRRHPA